MENMRGSMQDNDTTIHTDSRHRMGQRPISLAVNAGEGVGFQDIGSSFARAGGPSGSQRPAKTYKSKFKQSISRTKLDIEFSESSEDELLLSGNSSALPSPIRKLTGKPTTSAEQTVRVKVNETIQDLPSHPYYKPDDTIKKLKFNKTKKPVLLDVVVVDEEPPASSSLPSNSADQSQDIFKPISHDILLDDEIGLSNTASLHPPSVLTRVLSGREKSPSLTHFSACSETENKRSRSQLPSNSLSTQIEEAIPTPKSRPKPRVICNPRLPAGPDSTPRASMTISNSTRRTELPFRPKSPGPSENNTSNPVKPKPRPRIKQALGPTESMRRVPQEFPMSLSAKENASDGGSSDHGRTRIRNKGKGKAPASSTGTAKRLQPDSTFPTLSPLKSSSCRLEKSLKGKSRAPPAEELQNDNSPLPSAQASMRPFPMSTQLLESINRCSPIASQVKRVSDDSDAGHGRASKKLKDTISGKQYGVEDLDDFHMDDSIDVGYAKDPSTLCPYCDEQLPPHPTPSLQSLMSKARRKSYADPRPRNPRGLKAPLAIYISVCQRHRFELHQLPIALERGWPQIINFQKLPKRVARMKVELEAVILACDDQDGTKEPKSRSVFWREVKKEVKKQGSRTVVGVKGQFASFEKTQPGYYGEQGSVIIHQTLFNLFPPSSFDVSLVSPLTPAEFIQRVLVPEAATRLIAQDLNQSIEEATITLRESAQYGVAMFPDADSKRTAVDDDDEMGVADQIVMERARARRRELEEEERVEKEKIEEAARKANREERPSKGPKDTRKADKDAAAIESGSSHSKASTRSRTMKCRPKPRQRGAAVSTVQDEESDAMSVDGSTSERSTRSSVKEPKGPVQGSRPLPRTIELDEAEAMEVIDITTPRHTAPQKLKKVVDSTSSLYCMDGEDERTPRPQKYTCSTAIDISTRLGQSGHSGVPLRPLQIARGRTQTSTANGLSGGSSSQWRPFLRSNTPADLSEQSDASCQSRSSRRIIRSRRETADEMNVWLFGEPSSPDDY